MPHLFIIISFYVCISLILLFRTHVSLSRSVLYRTKTYFVDMSINELVINEGKRKKYGQVFDMFMMTLCVKTKHKTDDDRLRRTSERRSMMIRRLYVCLDLLTSIENVRNESYARDV